MLQLEAGKKYIDRDGNEVTIVDRDSHDTWPFNGSNGLSYTPEGYVRCESIKTSQDLISEMKEESATERVGGPKFDDYVEKLPVVRVTELTVVSPFFREQSIRLNLVREMGKEEKVRVNTEEPLVLDRDKWEALKEAVDQMFEKHVTKES